jgi:hypothetical protein
LKEQNLTGENKTQITGNKCFFKFKMLLSLNNTVCDNYTIINLLYIFVELSHR